MTVRLWSGCAVLGCVLGGSVAATTDDDLLGTLVAELDSTMTQFELPDGTRPYYVAYTVSDTESASTWATLGALGDPNQGRRRVLDVDVRVGDYELDNTHKLRTTGFNFGGRGDSSNVSTGVPLDDAPLAIRHEIWLATDRAVKAAAKQYQNVTTNLKTMVEEEDDADDFSREEPVESEAPDMSLDFDLEAWSGRVARVSALAREQPLILSSQVGVSASVENRYMVTSEGTRLKLGHAMYTAAVNAAAKADDGMQLQQSIQFHASEPAGLPDEAELAQAMRECIEMVMALREAPLVEPYTGPAILLNRASGVFFHEIFGHRIEGHRQRDVDEGQTFTKKIGQPVLPDFITVRDDPTRARFGETDLRGHYSFDDEGVPAQDVLLVDQGVLRTFLLSRQPVQEFARSNGHGRRNPGKAVVARQGNLIVESSRVVPFDELRGLLIEECLRQEKAYGLLFEDITGGFTTTSRSGPQAFKVLPVVVWKVYPDGRPDELVRGVDIVGTPLSCFEKIVATGDDPDVFNGTCGAESGWVPVSAVSPSVLVTSIEIEKRDREQDRPPILPAPEVAEGEQG